MKVTREQVLGYRVAAQAGEGILDIGVQDTGPAGARWALTVRGLRADNLVLVWTLRGAPHYYRRADVAAVAAAAAPYTEADAAKRVFDAATPLRKANIPVQEAMARIAREMRAVVTRPTAKGDLSTALAQRLPEPYLRWCRACQATHCYEQTFRLSTPQAGLELRPDTSPPVLQRIKGWRGPRADVPERLDVILAYLRLFGPATPQHVAGYVDGAVKDIKARWPADAVELVVDGERRWALPDFEPRETDQSDVRLLGPFDLYLQGRDRELLVPDPAHRKELWAALGRPGGIRQGVEVVGTWRPRATGGRLQVAVNLWRRVPKQLLEEQGERLAAFRGVPFAGLTGENWL